MAKNKQDFITDFLFEVNGQFHQPDYDMLDSFYDLLQKEYEEKLRWIPVEESMPIEREIVIIKVNRRLTEKVTSTHIAIGECMINSFTGNLWIFDKSYSAGYVTHWRHIL